MKNKKKDENDLFHFSIKRPRPPKCHQYFLRQFCYGTFQYLFKIDMITIIIIIIINLK